MTKAPVVTGIYFLQYTYVKQKSGGEIRCKYE
jgi:hypothetical protein